MGHFGPLLSICRHSHVQLSGLRKQFREEPGGQRAVLASKNMIIDIQRSVVLT